MRKDLTKRRAYSPAGSTIASPSNFPNKRYRKSFYELEVLNHYYELCGTWNKGLIKTLSQKTGLSQRQVYKWYWDRCSRKHSLEDLFCSEFLRVQDMEAAIHKVKNSYHSSFGVKNSLHCSEVL